jgi:hypothetical protein
VKSAFDNAVLNCSKKAAVLEYLCGWKITRTRADWAKFLAAVKVAMISVG